MIGALIDVVLIATLAGLVWFVFTERRRFEAELGKHRTLELSVDFLRREVQTATVAAGSAKEAVEEITKRGAITTEALYRHLKEVLRHGEGASIIHDDGARQIVIGAPEETKE